ncbi:hypothetical protein, variant [Aphanomyces invadans]|uniref:Uncharacterized protein n=1 Tax=Aphanomyces invadans TaxID=157072 RepID=A0A024TXV9_9STRA|nr:hypothetical protein, variant [Aphanomyces invadans]XP_008872419.1 hypothetical protein H310_08463 [Aphanomyces invadans]ETV98990.1 hypothetical protein H310_08463 [Aphanomyces invadans]ETV98991.1 hypothetical protein, variant [Aphanomyces invadans]|eukprot:XP_008872418.1 hypothetical protein, variant [Aphanomyces invadans]
MLLPLPSPLHSTPSIGANIAPRLIPLARTVSIYRNNFKTTCQAPESTGGARPRRSWDISSVCQWSPPRQGRNSNARSKQCKTCLTSLAMPKRSWPILSTCQSAI